MERIADLGDKSLYPATYIPSQPVREGETRAAIAPGIHAPSSPAHTLSYEDGETKGT
jgi:hypothetical protein